MLFRSTVIAKGIDEHFSDDFHVPFYFLRDFFKGGATIRDLQYLSNASDDDILKRTYYLNRRCKVRSYLSKNGELKNPNCLILKNAALCLGFDDSAKHIVLVSGGDDGDLLESERLLLSEIASAECYRETISVDVKVKSTKLGSAIVGAAVAGPLGAVVGAVVGRSERTDKSDTKFSMLKIIFENDIRPPIAFNFTKDGVATDSTSKWANVINFLIRKNRRNNNSKTITEKQNVTADQLRIAKIVKKISTLGRSLKSGKISEDEFNENKEKLLKSI